MMPEPSKPSPNAPETPANWLSVRAAALALGVSEKTVRKRIAAGELPARRVSQNRGGMAYLVALESETETEVETPETEANRNGSEKTPFQGASEPETEREANRKRDGSETEVELLRESLASERAQVAFLRGVIEGLQQSEATTKAALREALRAMPKQLSAGDSSARIEATGAQTGVSLDSIGDFLENLER